MIIIGYFFKTPRLVFEVVTTKACCILAQLIASLYAPNLVPTIERAFVHEICAIFTHYTKF